MWLHRQNPETPIYVYGQYVSTKPITMVYAPSGDELTNPAPNYPVHSNMIGNPYMYDVKLNDIKFSGTINSGDRIWMHNENGVNKDIIYQSGKGWREYTTLIVNGVKRSGYTYMTIVPAGMSFWYDRRGSEDMVVSWPDEK